MNRDRAAGYRAVGSSAIALLAALALGAPTFAASHQSPVVKTDEGVVIGALRDDVATFLGIPYAASPGGQNRFRPPLPRTPWTEPFHATAWGPICPQRSARGGKSQEDCLVLNVFAPPDLSGSRPVMVWIHGGGYTGGSGNLYDASAIVQQAKVVVVTINYRLGALGWMALPGLTAESPQHTSGNYGLLDQQAALRWVQRNIARFGGDPHNVTVFGESGGAGSIVGQLVSPAAAGLFTKAIIESQHYLPSFTLQEAEGQWRAGIEQADQPPPRGVALGCPISLAPEALVACLRAAPAEKLISLPNVALWGPIVDGTVVPVAPRQAIASGHFNRVPVMMGPTSNEGAFFVHSPVTSQKAYERALAEAFGPDIAPRVASRYTAREFGGSLTRAYAAAYGDWILVCPTARTIQALDRKVPLYSFEFSMRNPTAILPRAKALPELAGLPGHTTELAYVFGRDATGPLQSPRDVKLSRTMIGYWTDFASSADPNVPASGSSFESRPHWPRYTAQAPQVMSLSTHVGLEEGFIEKHRCDFWRTYGHPPTLPMR